MLCDTNQPAPPNARIDRIILAARLYEPDLFLDSCTMDTYIYTAPHWLEANI